MKLYIYSSEKYILASHVMLFFSLRYFISSFGMVLAKQILLAIGNEKVLMHIYYAGGREFYSEDSIIHRK
jgi:hypothetical protein